jgi:hypothetical protein
MTITSAWHVINYPCIWRFGASPAHSINPFEVIEHRCEMSNVNDIDTVVDR